MPGPSIRVFSYFKCIFEFDPGGSIVVESQIQTLSVENYKGDFTDNFRALCEVLFVLATGFAFYVEVRRLTLCS